MDGFELKDLAGNDINPFIKSYRESLKHQNDMALSQLKQENINREAGIMSKANKAGMMFSNFPQRNKLQNLSQTYLPSLAKQNETYQTGLQKIRNNSVEVYNNIKHLQDLIADLNDS